MVVDIDVDKMIHSLTNIQTHCKLYGCIEPNITGSNTITCRVINKLKTYSDSDLLSIAKFAITVNFKLWIQLIGLIIFDRCSKSNPKGKLELIEVPSKYIFSVKRKLSTILECGSTIDSQYKE
jgi:hypothetical protein